MEGRSSIASHLIRLVRITANLRQSERSIRAWGGIARH